MPGRMWLGTTGLNAVFDEVVAWNENRLSDVAGRKCIGVDGFKGADKRHVMNLTVFKSGVVSYLSTEWFGRKKHSGQTYAGVVAKYMGEDAHLNFIAVVADNTSSMVSMFTILATLYVGIFYLGCVVHVYDLLIEDIVKKISVIASLAEEIRFIVVMILSYSQLTELFREMGEKFHGASHKSLVLYPDTRFAYVYLMAKHVLFNYAILMNIPDTVEFKMLRKQVKASRRGQFDRFEELFATTTFKKKVTAVVYLLEPISKSLHLNESNSFPIALVPAVYNAVYDFVQVISIFRDLIGQSYSNPFQVFDFFTVLLNF